MCSDDHLAMGRTFLAIEDWTAANRGIKPLHRRAVATTPDREGNTLEADDRVPLGDMPNVPEHIVPHEISKDGRKSEERPWTRFFRLGRLNRMHQAARTPITMGHCSPEHDRGVHPRRRAISEGRTDLRRELYPVTSRRLPAAENCAERARGRRPAVQSLHQTIAGRMRTAFRQSDCRIEPPRDLSSPGIDTERKSKVAARHPPGGMISATRRIPQCFEKRILSLSSGYRRMSSRGTREF